MSEMIDVLDEHGIKTGRVATRDEVHREGLWHKIAAVAIIDSENRILLQRRSRTKITNPEKWDIAAAGHVDAGEDTLTTALRETAEEVGIQIQPEDLTHVISYQKTSKPMYGNQQIIDRQIFDCFVVRIPEINIKNLTLQISEVQAVKLATLDEFKEMISAGVMVNRQPFYDAIIKLMEEQISE